MSLQRVLGFALGICVCAPALAVTGAGIGFSAPNVNGSANVGNPQVGDIIFDTSTTSFIGY